MIEAFRYTFPTDMMYPYITGLVAGAFIVSSLYHVFHKEEYAPIGRFALLTSLAFLLCATMPLLNHLGHPERAMNIMITPHFTSAMAGFGVLYSFYLVVLVLEVWLVFRPDIVRLAQTLPGWKSLPYRLLALGVDDLRPETLALDRKVITILATIGIPAACLLHGYVGFLFGAIKANPWWSTPLMPIIFLFSAVVSGIALLIVLYQFVAKVRGDEISQPCLRGLARWLWYFQIQTITLELLEIITLAYERNEEWEIIAPLITHQLAFSFISVQMILGSLIPFILLMLAVLLDRYLHAKVRNTLTFTASLLLLIQVFSMRWNVVIGGQMMSKSLRGLRDFHPEFLAKEGVLAAILLFAIPFVLLYGLAKLLPPFGRAHQTS
ncbi:MAG: polysulfide reductase NrfD [Deltaproteobacteria bacterium]|nr:polysulfide reductase NrfD [Deltaproteobacteria bacterium]